MKRPIRTVATLAGFVALVAACSSGPGESQTPASQPESSTAEVAAAAAATDTADPTAPTGSDDSPGKLKVATRIVSLSPTATETLFAIGAGPLVVAVDSNSNYPAEAPVTDLSGFEPNVEAIAKYEPDLVVVSDDMGNVVAGLTALDITVLQMPAAADLDETFAQIEQLGAATGFIAQSAELVKNMQVDIDAAIASAPKSSGAPMTYYHELDPTFYSVTSTTFVGQIYAAFGMVNIADATSVPDTDGGYPQLSPEYIVAQNPLMIFLADVKCCQVTVESVGARPGWDQLSAVTGKAVIALDDDIASRWGPRVVEQYQTIAKALNSVTVG
jgi:iron complex transport system substrate-binding protein